MHTCSTYTYTKICTYTNLYIYISIYIYIYMIIHYFSDEYAHAACYTHTHTRISVIMCVCVCVCVCARARERECELTIQSPTFDFSRQCARSICACQKKITMPVIHTSISSPHDSQCILSSVCCRVLQLQCVAVFCSVL